MGKALDSAVEACQASPGQRDLGVPWPVNRRQTGTSDLEVMLESLVDDACSRAARQPLEDGRERQSVRNAVKSDGPLEA
ncbi:uncharacterized protein MEPE_01929 [Melanopsichium pennsylvanicum]|uniref:Uncharacterized protein n=1 Tax=Melanopsichium pennsylvanicum TaxID=63383 RepID=A0AAJ4XJE0_9BASI|nr:uncharacterized protein MEPE_01929 [Melanopsichium pennsylvanicum]